MARVPLIQDDDEAARLAQLAGSAYEWSHHRPMALAVTRIIQALGVEVEADHKQHLADWGPADARL